MKERKMWIRIARCSDIPLREGRAVKIHNQDIAVFNLGDRFLAVENRCPHKAGPLADGIISGGSIVCPLHAWKFSLETGEGLTTASASSCVQTYRTAVEDGVVLLEFGKDAQQDNGSSVERFPAICIGQDGTGAANDVTLGN